MHPTDLRWNITPILVMVLGLIVALCLGIFIGGSEVINLGVFFGLIGVIAVAASMRQHIWLLIPIFWGFSGTIPLLPLPFALKDLVLLLVAGVSFALFALRIFKFKNQWNFLDTILLLNIAQVATVFIMHPIGMHSLSSQRVGSRPYFNIAIAAVAYFILSNQSISPKLARRLPIWIIATELCSSALFLLSRTVKSIGFALGRVYDGFLPPAFHYGPTRWFPAYDGSRARRNVTDHGIMFIFSAACIVKSGAPLASILTSNWTYTGPDIGL